MIRECPFATKVIPLGPLAAIIFLSFASVGAGTDPDPAFTKQVADVLAECQKIVPGMTRSDLLKVFTTEGGLSTATQRTFVYRGCPYIKVDVEFKIADPKRVLKERSTDTIIKISKPYLQYTIID